MTHAACCMLHEARQLDAVAHGGTAAASVAQPPVRCASSHKQPLRPATVATLPSCPPTTSQCCVHSLPALSTPSARQPGHCAVQPAAQHAGLLLACAVLRPSSLCLNCLWQPQTGLRGAALRGSRHYWRQAPHAVPACVVWQRASQPAASPRAHLHSDQRDCHGTQKASVPPRARMAVTCGQHQDGRG